MREIAVMPGDLIHILTELQRDGDEFSGRRRLLEYVRAQAKARMALLFVMNQRRDALLLIEQRGRRARPPAWPDTIPLTGLFGAALTSEALMYVPRAAADPRTLDDEWAFLMPGDDVILVRIVQHNEARGMLMVCLEGTRQGTLASPAIDEANLLICSALLSTYLPEEGAEATPLRRSPRHHLPQLELDEDASDAIETALARERERIAGDLHDGVAQRLAFVLQRLELAQRTMESRPDLARQQIAEATRQLNESITELRSIIASPWTLPLETRSLEDALRHLVDEIRSAEPVLRIDEEYDDLGLLPVALESVVYRLVQEGLTNARKHAHAGRITLRVRVLTGMLVVEISDDGRGFAAGQAGGAGHNEHYGLQVMRSRVQQAGGTWEVQSRPGEGTNIRARFPLPVPLAYSRLTPREREVLRLIARGMTNRAIAESLSVSSETVKSHLHHIMQKMRVHDRTQAAVAATRQQLV